MTSQISLFPRRCPEYPAGNAAPPAVVRLDRLSLHGHVELLAAFDALGALAFSGAAFGLVATSLVATPRYLLARAGGFLIAWAMAANSQQLYRRHVLLSGRRNQILRALTAVALTFGTILLLAFGLQLGRNFYQPWLLAWWGGHCAWVVALRVVWHRRLPTYHARGRCLARAHVLTGSPCLGRPLAADLERETGGEIRVAATAALPGLAGAPSCAWVEETVRAGSVDRVFIVNFEGVTAETRTLLTRLQRLAVEVTLVQNFEGLQAPPLRVDTIGMRPVVDVNLLPLTRSQAFLKRAEDLVLVGLAMVLLLPIFGLICLAIKLDSRGPIFFKQWRAGYHDRRFLLWKFRTMYFHMCDAGAVRQTGRADARVTRLGRFLRRTSFDEIPQLINVLRGEMSIVGPRPHALGMTAVNQPLDQVIDDYPARHRVRPGITGWAQVSNCRGEVDSAEKLRRRVLLDCEYIASWSLTFDLWIILKTIFVIVSSRDAY